MSNYRVLMAILRNNFSSFIQRAFHTVSPGSVYLHGWHIDAIAYHLQLCLEGAIRRLIITMPPRSGKSIAASVAFTAYALGQDPSREIVCVSYSQDLANKHSRDTRAVMESDLYRELFPRTRLDREKNTQAEFVTTRKGFRLATSVFGTLLGRGGDIVILDDPLKPDDALSDSQRERTNDWIRNTLLSRLNDKQHGVIIVIQQRVHEDDPVGYFLEQGGWTHLNLPAIAEERQIIQLGPELVHVREEGDVLHPEREPREALMRLKSEMGSYAFHAQYQQSPAPRGGGIVKWEWFRVYDEPLEKRARDRIVQSWDTASKAEERNNYSVCTTWLIRDKTFYLQHVLRKRLEYPALRRTVFSHAGAYDADVILIEDKGSGIQLIQDLRDEGLNPKAIKPEGDKVMRMETQTAVLEAGRVLVPKSAPWLADFQDEVTKFPAGKYDDQVDSLSQFLGWATKRRRRRPRIIQL